LTLDEQGDSGASRLLSGEIPCVTWALDVNPVMLPSIPSLPSLTNEDNDNQELTRLIKIAGLDCHLIGLTNKGHVLKFGPLDDEETAPQGRWQYLPEYSEVEKIREHPVFSRPGMKPLKMRITHISANFTHFIAYSAGDDSIVLMGDIETSVDSKPKIIPALQNKGVISVQLGDYHNVALTSTGKVLTWGAYSAGALGLGDPATLSSGVPGGFTSDERRLLAQARGRGEPPAVEVPTEVRFDHGRKRPKDRFCFAVSAAGWHTGALAIDLEPDSEEEDDEVINTESDDRSLPRQPVFPTHGPGQSPPIIPRPGIFRVGYAGRGRGGFGFAGSGSGSG